MTEADKAKKRADVSRKLELARRKLKMVTVFLENDELHERDMSLSLLKVRQATNEVESLENELARLS